MDSLTNRVMAHVQSLHKSLGGKRGEPTAAGANKHGDLTLRGLRNWGPEDVIVDVGANDGRTINRINELLNGPRFFAFEPVERTYRNLLENTAHLDNVQCFHTALGETVEEKEIFVNEIDAMSSFLPEWGEVTHRETVRVSTLDRMMEELGIEFIHYLKIDTEGHEMAVLRGGRETLSKSRIAALQVEVGFDQVDKPLIALEEIRSFLKPFGYRLTGIFNQCHLLGKPPACPSEDHVSPRSARILAYVDAMFLRVD